MKRGEGGEGRGAHTTPPLTHPPTNCRSRGTRRRCSISITPPLLPLPPPPALSAAALRAADAAA